ncbi:MAG TPA: universal stress protein [Dissulfurispiraceae bacterium]|nr:universal stress protein [Dissulfurispiraceae bacterium]
MKKILIAVNDIESSKAVLSTYYNLMEHPEEIVLLHVVRSAGRSPMIKGTEPLEEGDRKAEKILNYYKNELGETVRTNIKTVKRDGQPADEILKVAEEEAPDLIIVGYSKEKGLSGLISGSVAGKIKKRAKIPVILAKKASMCEEPYSWRDACYAISLCTGVFLALLVLSRIL